MIVQRLKSYLRSVLKYDTNEYARRFLAGDDLGETVGEYTPEGALRIATVYSCVRVISESLASVPLTVMRRLGGGGAEEATDHPLYPLLRLKATRYGTSFDWVERLVAHICLRGNHVSLKVRDGGRVVRFLPVHPSRVTLEEYDDVIVYRIAQPDGSFLRLLAADVLHVPGLALEGHWGLSPIGQVKETFGLARRVAKYGNSVFESGGAKRVLLKFPNPLGDKEHENLRRSWEEMGRNSAKTAILEDGGDAATIGMDADEAQYIETRKYTRSEICGIYRVPPHMVADLDRATYSNIEKQDLYFVKHTLRPWCKRIEAVLNADLELIGNPRRYFVTFNLDALLRADIKTRTEALKTQFMHGALTVNEWRGLENRNPIATEEGDQHFVPMNLTPIDRLAEVQTPAPAADEPTDEPGGVGGSDNTPKHCLEPLAADIASRLVNRELREKPRVRDFEEFVTQHRIYAYRALAPLLAAVGDTDEQRRERLATALMAGLAEGSEIDMEQRQRYVTASIMAVVTDEPFDMARWHAQAAAAARALGAAARQ